MPLVAFLSVYLPRHFSEFGVTDKRVLVKTGIVGRHTLETFLTKVETESARLTGKGRRFIKGQKYTLLSHRENLTTDGRRSLKLLLTANRRLSPAYILKEEFGQLWDYEREG